ncbi:MAG: hypothetical protein LCH41_11515 [Armatimonadetes bacterium]|nr:hypothetical protein [Armatimonadota bacterium]
MVLGLVQGEDAALDRLEASALFAAWKDSYRATVHRTPHQLRVQVEASRAAIDLALLAQESYGLSSAVAPLEPATRSARFASLERILGEVSLGYPLFIGEVWAADLPAVTGRPPTDLGWQRFDDLLPEERVFILAPEGLSLPKQERLGLAMIDHNLPSVWDSFVGRDEDMSNALDRLRHADILSLKGCGGMGKSRFSLHLAAQSRQLGITHIRQVRLSDLTDPRDVAQRFLATTRATDLSTFAQSLHGRSSLVILDNCEHVLSGVQEFLPELLDSCPTLKVICTTRESLLLPGEVIFELEPLALPPDEWSSDQVIVEPSGAIQLFLDRYAEMASEELDLRADMPLIRALVALVDGLPLAVEQAAFQASILGVGACLASLRKSLPGLEAERAHYEPRHRTISATMQWSYDLLNPEEKRDLHAAASFICPFDARDLAAMLGEQNATSRLGNLHRKSLVQREGVIGGHRMFRIIEVIAEFVRTHPDRPARDPGWPESWLAFLEDIAERVATNESSPAGAVSRDQSRTQMPMWSKTIFSLRETDPPRAERLLILLGREYLNGGFYAELQQLVLSLLEKLDDPRPRTVQMEAMTYYLLGDLATALVKMTRGLEIAHQTQDTLSLMRGYQNRALILSSLGRTDEAITAMQECLKYSRESGGLESIFLALTNLARLKLNAGKPEEALSLIAEARALPFDQSAHSEMSSLLLAEIYHQLNDLPQMGAALRDGLSVVEADTVEDQMPGLILRGAVYLALMRQWQDACRAYGGAKEGYTVLGMMVAAAKRYEAIYFDLVHDVPEADRLRWELEGAVSPPRTWCRHARAAIERTLLESST